MSEAILLASPGSRQRALDVIGAQPIDGSMEVELRKRAARRSLAQNRLLFSWHTVMAEYRNDTECDADNPTSKSHEHSRWKWAHVASIYDRDGYPPEVKTPHGVPVQAIREDLLLVDFGSAAIREAMLAAFAEKYYPSSKLSVEQMTEALDEYDKAAQARGCVFPTSDTIYYEAMGISP